MIGGAGEKKTLRMVAQYADESNLTSPSAELPHKLEVLAAHCERLGRPRSEITVSQALNFVVGDSHDDAYKSIVGFLGDRGLDVESMDESTHDQILSMVVWGDEDEVGEKIGARARAGSGRHHLFASRHRLHARQGRAARQGRFEGAGTLMSPVLAASHDRAHPVEGDGTWSESYYFNCYDPDADVGFYTRVGVRPNEGTIDVGLAVWLPGGGIDHLHHQREQREMVDAVLDVGPVRYEMLEPMQRWRLTASGPRAQRPRRDGCHVRRSHPRDRCRRPGSRGV